MWGGRGEEGRHKTPRHFLRHALAGSILEGDESLEERKESLGDLLRDLLPAEDQVEDVLAEILRQWDALQVSRNLDFRLSSLTKIHKHNL